MTSKFSRFCEGVIESGWLLAVIVIPLFFNVFSARVFEPDKITILRSIALVMLAAWLAKTLDHWWVQRQIRQQQNATAPQGSDAAEGEGREVSSFASRLAVLWRTPLVLPTLLLVGAYLLSTVLSIAPRLSLFGSYQRMQGTYTMLAYVAIFFMVLMHLRTQAQLRRLQYAVIITSLPVALYMLIQAVGADPLPWGGDVQRRPSANMGNPIFVAAYLIMAFFLTLERALTSFWQLLRVDESEPNQQSQIAHTILGGCYLFIMSVHVLAVFLSQSRGPLLGLLGGLYIFVLMVLVTRGHRKLWWGWIGVTAIGAGFLVVVNLPNTPLPGFKDVPYVGRLARVFETEAGTGRVRILIWDGAVEMIQPHPPLQFPDGSPDRVNPVRPLIGYGPETMWVAYNRFYPPELAHYEARNASPDRSHNETFDALVITGYLGFLAYIALFVSVFYYGLRWLGLLLDKRDTLLYAGLTVSGMVIGVLLPRVLQGSWSMAGVGLPAGLIIGVILYLTMAAVSKKHAVEAGGLTPNRFLTVAILSIIVAHFIEIHFGIAIVATRTYFWLLAALLVIVGMSWLPMQPQPQPAPVPAQQPKSRKRRRRGGQQAAHFGQSFEFGEIWGFAGLGAVIFITLAYNFTTNPTGSQSAVEIFINSFTTRREGGEMVASLLLLWMLVFTWGVGMVTALAELSHSQNRPTDLGWWAVNGLIYSGVTGSAFLIYGLIQAGRLQPIAATEFQAAQHVAGHFNLYVVVLILVILVMATLLVWSALRQRQLPALNHVLGPAAGVPAMILALVIIFGFNTATVNADTIYKQGQTLDNHAGSAANRNDQEEARNLYVNALQHYLEAVQQSPLEDHYHLFIGRVLLEMAKITGPVEERTLRNPITEGQVFGLSNRQWQLLGREELLQTAEVMLLRAQNLNPLNTDHTANLARLYRTWGELENDPERRTALWHRSLAHYQDAINLSPNAAHLRNELALVYQFLGEEDKALAELEYSLALDERFEQTYYILGELYRNQGELEKAAELYEAALQHRPQDVQVRSALGLVYARMGNAEEAIEQNLAVIEQSPNDFVSYRNLAVLYNEAGQYEAAAAAAEHAARLAPEGDRATLVQFAGDMHRQAGNAPAAIAAYEQALAQTPAEQRDGGDPSLAAMFAALAELYEQEDRLSDALSARETAASLTPADWRHQWDLAQTYAQMQLWDEARNVAEQALALAPSEQAESIRDFIASLPG